MKPLFIVRVLGLVALAAAAVAVVALVQPETPSVPDHSGEITAALTDAAVNEASAESAPQQQVVNGWVARDLLEVVAEQNDAALQLGAREEDQRPTLLLLLAVLAISWIGVTSPIVEPRATVEPANQPLDGPDHHEGVQSPPAPA